MDATTRGDLSIYLKPTWFINSDHAEVRAFAEREMGDARSDRDKAVRLFYAVRDQIRYSAYGIRLDRESLRASSVLESGYGWCVTKSCLLAAVCRAVGVPCRLGYATVRNHLATRKLLEAMGTDLFYYHGYNEILIDGRWIKATVAFNRELCEKARIRPLEWDGRNDSLYHPYDLEGRRHMEYLEDYGHFADIPYDEMVAKFAEVYGGFMSGSPLSRQNQADFQREIESESRDA